MKTIYYLFSVILSVLMSSCYHNEFSIKDASIPERSKPKISDINTAVAYGDIYKLPDSGNQDEKLLFEAINFIRHNDIQKADSILKLINSDDNILISSKKILQNYTENIYDKLNLQVPEMKMVKNAVSKAKIIDNRVFVDVKLEGENYRFLVDNGYKNSVILKKLVSKIKGKSIGSKSSISDINGANREHEIFLVEEMNFANINVKNLAVSLVDNSDSEYDGVIGMDVLKEFDVRIDFKKATIEFREPVPVDNKSEYLYSWMGAPVLFALSCEGYELRMLPDLGSNTSFLFSGLFETFPIEKKVVDQKTASLRGGNSEQDYTFDIVSGVCINIAGKSIEFNKIAVNDQFDVLPTMYFGLLGNDLWQNGTIRLDYKNGIFEYYE